MTDINANSITKQISLTILTALCISCTTNEKQCNIIGEVRGGNKEALILFKASKFPNIETTIPIQDSSFNYTVKFQHPEVYELVFSDEFYNGTMSVTSFFIEEGNIKISLKPGTKITDNKVSRHDLNEALTKYDNTMRELFWDRILTYNDSIKELTKKGAILSPEATSLIEKLQVTTDDSIRKQLYNEKKYLQNTGRLYTPTARKYIQTQDSINNQKKLWEFDYMDNNTTLVSYYKFMMDIRETARLCCWQEVDIELINKAQITLTRFKKAFPDHPYYTIIQNTINGLQTVHEGGRFIDFAAPDINGNKIPLSNLIKNNKFTLLDFWSKWCGPCMNTSKQLIPIYEKYKNEGFEIVGITQDYDKIDSIESFIRKQNYPWLTIIDKGQKIGVWDKYNLSQQAGGLFLINASGQIIAVNLSSEKVNQLLEDNFK